MTSLVIMSLHLVGQTNSRLSCSRCAFALCSTPYSAYCMAGSSSRVLCKCRIVVVESCICCTFPHAQKQQQAMTWESCLSI